MEQRKYPRYKTSPQFKIKARIKKIGEKKIAYLKVDTLSMGGLSLEGNEPQIDFLRQGERYEVMLYHRHQSLKMIIDIVTFTNPGETALRLGAKIVGIDETGRLTLAEFIEKMELDSRSITSPAPKASQA